VIARRDVAQRLALTALSGALYALAFPPVHAQALAWIALVPWLVALRGATLGARLGLAVLWSFVAGWGVGTWMPGAVAGYFDQPWAVGFGLFVLVTACMATPYYALFAALYGRIARRRGVAAPLVAGAAWAGAELLRGRLLNGTPIYVGSSPWATFGASQFGVGPLVQVASLGGVYAISFVLACANAALAELVATAWRERATPRRALGGAALAAAVVAAALGFGAWALSGADDAAPGPATAIALVQGDLSAAARWDAGGAARTLETYGRLTQRALEREPARVVFWPEAALTFFLEREPLYERALGRLLAPYDAELVAGAPRAEGADGAPPYRNSVYLVDASGTIRARYDKQRLLPFMEWFPVGVDLLRRRFGRIREFSPGGAATLLPTRAGAAGVLVCNEALLPHLAAERMAAGATYLVNPSNDSWVSDPGFAEHQLALVALRAVEQRAFLVRVSDAGASAVVDPFGRVVARSEPGTATTVAATIAPGAARSLYGRIGDAFGLACLALAVAAAALPIGIASRARPRRAPRPGDRPACD